MLTELFSVRLPPLPPGEKGIDYGGEVKDGTFLGNAKTAPELHAKSQGCYPKKIKFLVWKKGLF